jgi:hypothetical protein
MSYTAECADCGRTVVIPSPDERVTRGEQGRRTISERREQYMAAADGPVAPEDVPDEIPRWDHYCPEHAEERGLL